MSLAHWCLAIHLQDLVPDKRMRIFRGACGDKCSLPGSIFTTASDGDTKTNDATPCCRLGRRCLATFHLGLPPCPTHLKQHGRRPLSLLIRRP